MSINAVNFHEDIKEFIVNFEDLRLEDIINCNKNLLTVVYKDTQFQFRIFLKNSSNSLIVFSNGARDLEKTTLPLFQRGTWYNEFESNCIFVNDPTWNNTDYKIAWGIGTADHYYLESIGMIIQKICEYLSILPKNTYYFGSSAGGFQSLMLSSMHEDSNVIANNCQFFVDMERAYNFFNDACKKVDLNEFKKDFYRRFSFYKYYKEKKYFPRIRYIVNMSSESDMVKHYQRFINHLENNPRYKSRVEITLYHANGGHGGIYPKHDIIHFINKYINKDSSLEETEKIDVDGTNETFDVLNEKGLVEDKITYRDFIYVPKFYFKKNYAIRKKFVFNKKFGHFHLALLSPFYKANGYGKDTLCYEILLNDRVIASEDMMLSDVRNDITIYNLRRNDSITVSINIQQTKTSNSWQKASMLEILDFNESISDSKPNVVITCTSPFTELYVSD